ncbi:hypothetical protein CP532_4846 [Ophiocordyceps camponoti-leonardi (nom. inval.)]|nr:hypothetical protein CP532_4846 [Ophiocordyceps camponoti-leonardi (nom. inval.)]
MHGYSSSEESDDPRRPRPQPTNDTNQTQKKKRKKRLAPQQSINANWKKFSNRTFRAALCVLPFDPVAPAASETPNELLSEGYERAAEECRRKVNKIAQECRRVNMRYRDPGWDLDWDLKYQKGNCLNSLGDKKFELSNATILSSGASVPKAVKRLHEIFERPTFMRQVSGGDVKQGSLGDCWIMAGLTAMANVEAGIRRSCVAHDIKIGIYGFVFYRDGEWIYSIIDDKLYLKSPCWDCPSMQRDLLQQIDREDVEKVYRRTYQTGSKSLFFAQCRDQNETWVPLIEKAYAKAHGDYASLNGGYVGEAIEDLSGGVTTELLSADILDTDLFWDCEMSRVNDEFLFGCSTGLLEHGYGQRDGICEGHAYIVLEARTLSHSGERLVKLRNPWGKVRKGVWEGPWSDGSKEWTAQAQAELGHTFGNDSVFWIPYEDLLRKFTHFDRTRLFRETDWRCCQRWIGVDVPWRADYHEKFHLRLSCASPVVLALSQLDGRYFKGLHGQYVFRIHFRLHQQDRPHAEDFIVRSHGNYFMKRSVAVEIPDLPAGSYVVYLKVVGERDGDLPSVEEVVRRECKGREENEKLATVGYAYDVAHSKAWAHLDKVASLRKRRDRNKASGCRREERRRQWEKRQMTRSVKRQQKEKNEVKKKKKNKDRKSHDSDDEEEAEDEREEAGQEEDEERENNGGKGVKSDQEESTAKTDSTTTSSASSCASSSPRDTPKSQASIIVPSMEKQQVPPVAGPPPPPATRSANKKKKKAQTKKKDSDSDEGDTSDSPVEDWEALYSSDDLTRKPRLTSRPPRPPRDDYDTEEEKMPDPWNAVCIVGIRVYSKDARLQLRTVMEGDELLEDGMGEKGGEELDNAQVNASGMRADDQRDETA